MFVESIRSAIKCLKVYQMLSLTVATIFLCQREILATYHNEGSCKRLGGKVLYNKCLKVEGVRDVSKDKTCMRMPKGKLLAFKKNEELREIADAFQYIRNRIANDKMIKYELFVYLSQHLKMSDVLTFKCRRVHNGHQRSESDSGSICLEGRKNNDYYASQHRPLCLNIDFDKNKVVMHSNQHRSKNDKGFSMPKRIKPFPQDLKKEKFEITISYGIFGYGKTKFKVGIVGKNTNFEYYLYINPAHYINVITVFGNAFELESATLKNNELWFGKEDKFYADCMVVGLYKNPKAGWVWGDGQTAFPSETSWDTAVREPDNKLGNENYGCLNVNTKKLRDVSNILKRYVICEYDCLTTTTTTAASSTTTTMTTTTPKTTSTTFTATTTSSTTTPSTTPTTTRTTSTTSTTTTRTTSTTTPTTSTTTRTTTPTTTRTTSTTTPTTTRTTSTTTTPTTTRTTSTTAPTTSTTTRTTTPTTTRTTSTTTPTTSTSTPTTSTTTTPPAARTTIPPTTTRTTPMTIPPTTTRTTSTTIPPTTTRTTPTTTVTTTTTLTTATTNSPTTTTATTTITTTTTSTTTTTPPTTSTSSTTTAATTTTTATPFIKTTIIITTDPSITTTPKTTTHYKLSKVEQIHKVAAKVALSLGSSTIIFSCSAVIVIFLILREFSHERCLHMSQEFCLMCSHLLIVLFWDKFENRFLCQIANKGSQLFFIALFNFMVLESFHGYAILTNVVRRGAWHGRLKCQLLGWSIAIGCLSLTSMMNLDCKWSCWVNYDQPSIWLLGFIFIIVGFCTTAVFTESMGMDMRKPIFGCNTCQRTAALVNRIGMITLLPLQTASFFISSTAMYQFTKNDTFFLSDITFVINTTLSVQIFLFHCMGNPKAHELVIKLWKKVYHRKPKIATPPQPRYIYYP